MGRMLPAAAQTIVEEYMLFAFFSVKKLCPQSAKSLCEVFSSLVISFTILPRRNCEMLPQDILTIELPVDCMQFIRHAPLCIRV